MVSPSQLSPFQLRARIRSGGHKGHPSGYCAGFVQANVAILPRDWAGEFLQFCQFNPKPCPLIAMAAEPGDTHIEGVGPDFDIRTDVPRYRLWRDGELAAEVDDIRDHWRDDLVTFLIGCSFSFEEALLADGLEIRNRGSQCAHVQYPHRLPSRRPPAQQDGGQYAPLQAGRRHPHDPDLFALSLGARRAGALWRSGRHRHR